MTLILSLLLVPLSELSVLDSLSVSSVCRMGFGLLCRILRMCLVSLSSIFCIVVWCSVVCSFGLGVVSVVGLGCVVLFLLS